MVHKNFYNTILCQAFSPCGNLLVVGDLYGTLSIFHLNKIIHPETNLTKNDLLPKHLVVVKEDYQVNSLLSTQQFLIVGGVGEIYGFNWRNIKTNKAHPAWTIEIPEYKDGFEKTDINCLLYNEEMGAIYAGCGDNKIYVFDIETRQLKKAMEKHEDYIHCMCSINSELISGGEDGLIKVWDLKSGKLINEINPSSDSTVARPNLGKWIGAVSANDDYILCGGGPRLSLWHSRFLANTAVYPIDDEGIHVAEIFEDTILAGGRSKLFYQMSFVGTIISEIQTSAVTTYSAVHQEEPFKVLSIAGSSPKIDICNNAMYKDQILSLY